jgi:hypothetical protein
MPKLFNILIVYMSLRTTWLPSYNDQVIHLRISEAQRSFATVSK